MTNARPLAKLLKGWMASSGNLRWYLAPLLFPASLMYGLVVFFRNFFFQTGLFKSVAFPVPVISVGNITAGGTGKTPHVEYLVNLLLQGHQVAVLSRGYRRKSKGFLLAGKRSKVHEIGDESLQLRRKFSSLIVAVDHSRVHGIARVMDLYPGLEVILLDDAFQHRYVKPGLSIVLVDYTRPVFNDFLLPLGNLRESSRQINRSDMVVVTKCPGDLNALQRKDFIKHLRLRDHLPVFFTSYRYGEPVPVFRKRAKSFDMKEVTGKSAGILLVTGIASNKPLKEYLALHADEIAVMSFPDHHYYNSDDIRLIKSKFRELKSAVKILITTEKDAIRFREYSGKIGKLSSVLYYIPIEVKFLAKGEKAFIKRILKYTGM